MYDYALSAARPPSAVRTYLIDGNQWQTLCLATGRAHLPVYSPTAIAIGSALMLLLITAGVLAAAVSRRHR